MAAEKDNSRKIILTDDEKQSLALCAQKYFKIDNPDEFSICEYNFTLPNTQLGYLGSYKIGTVRIKHENQDKIMPTFIKTLMEDELRAKEIKELGFFDRERCAYSDIFSQFRKRTDDDIFHPNFFFVNNDKFYFEDMSAKGYRMTHAREFLDDDHILLTLTQIGKMHAESIILEEKKTKELNYPYRIGDHYKLNDYGYIYEGWFYIGVNAGLELAKLSPNIPKNVNMKLFTERWHEFFKIALDMCKPSKKIRNVLSHRDLWRNNLMYRYDDDGKPVQSIMVDFQGFGPMAPAGDVMGFIYLNIGDDRRIWNLEKYLKHYYRSLSEELMSDGLHVEKFVPWKEFRDSCEEYKTYGLMQCIILLQLGLLEENQAFDIFKDPDLHEYYMNVTRTDLVVDFFIKDRVFRKILLYSIDEIIQSLYTYIK